MIIIISIFAFALFHMFYFMFDMGAALRSKYAFKIARYEGIFSFFWVYFYSYILNGTQINEDSDYDPLMNANLERLLNLTLNDHSLIEGHSTRIWIKNPKNDSSFTNRITVVDIENGEINGNAVLLHPIIFQLTQKLISELDVNDRKQKESIL